MFKKRALLLFFTIFLTSLFSEESPLEIVTDAFNNQPKVFYSEGLLSYKDNSFDFRVFIENKDYFKSNYSLAINERVYKSFETEERIENTNIPLDIINFNLEHKEYNLLRSKSIKNINSYRIIITSSNEEIIELPFETKNQSRSNISEDNDSDTNITDTNERVLEEPLKKPYGRFNKIIFSIPTYPKTIIKKEFYINETDKNPVYIYEAENILFIKNQYIVTDWIITDTKTNNIYKFKLNVESITYNKSEVKDTSLYNFNGVK